MAHFRVTWKRIDGFKTELEDIFADASDISPHGELVFRKEGILVKAYAVGRWVEVDRVKA
jgi:hypothetical protein